MALALGQSRVPLAELHESPANPRVISDERLRALEATLKADPAMLAARPVIATPEGEVVCGNMRYRAACNLQAAGEPGWATIETFVADLSPAQKREWMLRDNQEYGDWVADELAALVAEQAEDPAADTALLGFTEAEIKTILGDVDRPDDPPASAAAEPPDIFGVIVECESERDQTELLERLAGEGRAVRALL